MIVIRPPPNTRRPKYTDDPSGLTLLMKTVRTQNSRILSAATSVVVPVTVYLPNRYLHIAALCSINIVRREPFSVIVNPATFTIEEIIRKLLLRHREEQLKPALHYHAAHCYELRLHEGDGYPDKDFPALDRNRILKQFGNVSEYCLCERPGVPVPVSPPTPVNTMLAENTDLYSDFSVSILQICIYAVFDL